MTREVKSYGINLYADEGRAIKHTSAPGNRSTIVSICVPAAHAELWVDCDYGEESTEDEA